MTHEPMVNRLSPLVTPPLLSVPMVEDREAVGLAPACVETPPPHHPREPDGSGGTHSNAAANGGG